VERYLVCFCFPTGYITGLGGRKNDMRKIKKSLIGWMWIGALKTWNHYSTPVIHHSKKQAIKSWGTKDISRVCITIEEK